MKQAPRLAPIAMALTLSSCVSASPAPVANRDAGGRPRVEVAVTFDDLPIHGPVPPGTDRLALARRIVTVLQAHHLPPVYGFVNGKRTDDDPPMEAVLREWLAVGNRLGNHTYSHVSLNALALADYLADLDRGEEILSRLEPAESWKVFRYPFLFEGDTHDKRDGVRQHLAARGYTIAEVTIDADDWAFNPPYSRCAARGDQATLTRLHHDLVEAHVEELRRMRELGRLLAGREVRQVLLLHLGIAESETLDDLLTAYEREGAVWITLEQALADPFFSNPPDLLARYGAAYPYRIAKARGVPSPPAIFQRGLEEKLDAICR